MWSDGFTSFDEFGEDRVTITRGGGSAGPNHSVDLEVVKYMSAKALANLLRMVYRYGAQDALYHLRNSHRDAIGHVEMELDNFTNTGTAKEKVRASDGQ